MIKQGKKKSTLNDRVHLLEMVIIKLAESVSLLKKHNDKLTQNQNMIIDSISPPNEEGNDVDEARSTGV